MMVIISQQDANSAAVLLPRLNRLAPVIRRLCGIRQLCLMIVLSAGFTESGSTALAQDGRQSSSVYSSVRDEELDGAPEPTALFRQAESGRRLDGEASRRRQKQSEPDSRAISPLVTQASYEVDESVSDPEIATADRDVEDQPFLDLTADMEGPLRESSGRTSANESAEPIIRTMATCVIIGCVAILGILGLRRWQRSRGLLPGAGGRSRVIETLSLGPGRTVSLIEMDGIRALVGADSGGIRTIVMAPRGFSEELAEQHVSELSSLNL